MYACLIKKYCHMHCFCVSLKSIQVKKINSDLKNQRKVMEFNSLHISGHRGYIINRLCKRRYLIV